MRGVFAIKDPEHTEMTLTLTATLSDWRKIAKLVQDPADDAPWQIRRIIQETVAMASQKFEVDEP